MEIIKANLCFHFNKKSTKQFLYEEKYINISEAIISKVFKKIMETIYYYKLQYEAEKFGTENNNEYFVAEESLFIHLNHEQIWV